MAAPRGHRCGSLRARRWSGARAPLARARSRARTACFGTSARASRSVERTLGARAATRRPSRPRPPPASAIGALPNRALAGEELAAARARRRRRGGLASAWRRRGATAPRPRRGEHFDRRARRREAAAEGASLVLRPSVARRPRSCALGGARSYARRPAWPPFAGIARDRCRRGAARRAARRRSAARARVESPTVDEARRRRRRPATPTSRRPPPPPYTAESTARRTVSRGVRSATARSVRARLRATARALALGAAAALLARGAASAPPRRPRRAPTIATRNTTPAPAAAAAAAAARRRRRCLAAAICRTRPERRAAATRRRERRERATPPFTEMSTAAPREYAQTKYSREAPLEPTAAPPAELVGRDHDPSRRDDRRVASSVHSSDPPRARARLGVAAALVASALPARARAQTMACVASIAFRPAGGSATSARRAARRRIAGAEAFHWSGSATCRAGWTSAGARE